MATSFDDLDTEASRNAAASGLTRDANGNPVWAPTGGAPHRTDPASAAKSAAAPDGYFYNSRTGQYEQRHMSIAEKVAIMGALTAATVGTAGLLAPYTGPTMAAVLAGAGTGAVGGGIQGGAKGALIGAGLGAAGGYAGAGNIPGVGSAGGTAATKTGEEIAKNVAIKAGVGAAQGAASGGGLKGALIGAGTGAAGAGVSGATQNMGLATRLAAQAGTKAAIGAATNGTAGAIQGATAGAGGAMSTPTTGQGIDWTQFALQTALPIAGSVASGLVTGREAGRTQQANQAITQDTQKANIDANYEKALEQRAALELAQKQDTRSSQSDAYKNALRSSLLLNLKDASFNRPDGVPNITLTGGLRPSAIGPQAHQAAQLMNQHALDALMHGESYTDLPAVEKSAVSNLPQPSSLDNVLGIVGSAGNALSALNTQQTQQSQNSIVQKLLQQAQAQASQGVKSTPITTQLPPAPSTTYGTVMPNPMMPNQSQPEYDWAE